MKNAASFNPMRDKSAPRNVSTGPATPPGETHKGGAGSQMGPTIAKEYPLTGSTDTHGTGGGFAKANSAKMSKTSKKGA